jgi:hypothetical protein
MGIINTRSPHFLSVSDTDLATATLDIEIYTGNETTGYSGTPQYSLSKKIILNTTKISFEISELIRDYLDITFEGDYESSAEQFCKWVRTTLTAFDGNGIQLSQAISTDLAFESYGYFEDGANYSFEYEGLLMSNSEMFIESGDEIKIPIQTDRTVTVRFYDSDNGLLNTETFSLSDQSQDKVVYASYTDDQAAKATIQYTGDSGSETSTIKITQLSECKFTPYKTTFINKFGVLQDLYFFKKSVEKMTTKRESYKANILASNNTYNTYNHTKRDFNIEANESVSLSSGFVNESYNEVFKQMMLSEKVWITNANNQVYPINIKTSNITYKTSVNDRLVEYTIEFDNSYNVLNDIR